jgi:hypothetical protein
MSDELKRKHNQPFHGLAYLTWAMENQQKTPVFELFEHVFDMSKEETEAFLAERADPLKHMQDCADRLGKAAEDSINKKLMETLYE